VFCLTMTLLLFLRPPTIFFAPQLISPTSSPTARRRSRRPSFSKRSAGNGLAGNSGADGRRVRRSRDAGERSSPGRTIGPRFMRSIARDDCSVGLGREPECPRPARPRNSVGCGRTATGHRRGTDAHRSATAPLPARRRAFPTPSRRSAAPKNGLPASQIAAPKYPPSCVNSQRALAVAEGFEPSDGFSRHTLSRRAP
jgi:hypothetical protein